MAGELIIMGIFLSIIVGLIFCYLIILIKKRSLVKNAIKRIKKQKIKYRIGGRKYNFTGGDDDGLEKETPSVPIRAKVTEKAEKKKPKTKKKIKKRKYLSTLKAYQQKKEKKR